jgi:ribosomal protein S18 acetylase RimI-like enzyme
MFYAMRIIISVSALLIAAASGFAPSIEHRRVSSSVFSTASASDSASAAVRHLVESVENDDRVLDVASFRNGLTNPEMMVEKAKKKLAKTDRNKETINGLKTGLLYVGPVIALASYQGTGDAVKAATDYAVLGGGLGAILAANSYMGKSVHIPDIPEATNRIIVDWSEGLLRKQDIGFVAISDDPMFQPARGVMAAVDAQLRNSDKAHPGARTVPDLPAHLHIKNMEVHSSQRRRGVGQALVDFIIQYAKDKTDAEALTLEVEKSNPAAVNLYRKNGFEERENPSKLSPNMFMVRAL